MEETLLILRWNGKKRTDAQGCGQAREAGSGWVEEIYIH